MSSPNEITDCTNTLWHVQTAIPTGHVMAKATAESILDHFQPLPQQKRVIRLWALGWKGSLMQGFPSRGHFWFTHHFASCFFVLLHRHLRELKQRWCCLLKNKDIVALAPLSCLPLPSNKFYEVLIFNSCLQQSWCHFFFFLLLKKDPQSTSPACSGISPTFLPYFYFHFQCFVNIHYPQKLKRHSNRNTTRAPWKGKQTNHLLDYVLCPLQRQDTSHQRHCTN